MDFIHRGQMEMTRSYGHTTQCFGQVVAALGIPIARFKSMKKPIQEPGPGG